MRNVNDGGPAFPFKCEDSAGATEFHYGMPLRDYFASKALMGLVVGVAGYIGNTLESKDFSAYAKGRCNAAIVERAYVLADAMLAEREREK